MIVCKFGVSLRAYIDYCGFAEQVNWAERVRDETTWISIYFIKDYAMNKILLAMLAGLFAVGAYAADAPKAEGVGHKAESAKHTAAPAKKAKLLKQEAKKETVSATTK